MKIAKSKKIARTKTETFLASNGQNLFRTVDKSWKKINVWSQQSFKKNKKMPHFDHFPRPGESDPYDSIFYYTEGVILSKIPWKESWESAFDEFSGEDSFRPTLMVVHQHQCGTTQVPVCAMVSHPNVTKYQVVRQPLEPKSSVHNKDPPRSSPANYS